MGCEEVMRVMRDGKHLLILIVAKIGESFECVCEREGRRAQEADESCKKGWQRHRTQTVALMLSVEMGYVG